MVKHTHARTHAQMDGWIKLPSVAIGRGWCCRRGGRGSLPEGRRKPGRATEVRVGLGQQAVLPCTVDAVRIGGAHHVTHIVFSFVTPRGAAPIYRVNNQGGRVTHWATKGYERRALVHWRPGSSLARLVLEKAALADEGIYGCHVYTSTSSSHTTSTVSLSVFAPPTSIRIYSDLDPGNEVTGEVGPYDLEEVVTFSCRVTEGHPRPTVTWYEGSRILQDTHVTHTDLTHSTTTRSDVTVGPLTREDLYRNLTCRASTSDLFEPLEASVTLDLRYPPNSVRIAGEWEGQLTVRAGAARKVVCLVAGGRPTPTITLSLGTDPLPSSPEEEVEGSGMVTVTASRAEITPSVEQDGEVLTCSAHSPPFLPITTSVRLVVLYPPRVRIRHGLNLPKEIKEGDDFLFYCEVTANPTVEEVTWTLNGETVQNDPSQGIDAHGLELYLEGVSRSSSGEYRCSAKNSEGEAVSEPYYLKVRGKPEAVTSCSVASSSPSKTKTVTMEVRCVAKADGDLSKIFYLKVKRKGQQKAEKGQHRQVKPVFTVKGLKPGDYDLTVTATNDFGNSPPYTFTHTIHDPTSLPPPSTSTSTSPPSSSSSDSAFESASNLSSQSNSSPSSSSSSSSSSSASASASVSVSPSVTNSVSVTSYTTATATSAAASISPTPSLFSFSLSTSFSSPMIPESTDSFDFKAPSLRSSSSSSTSSFPAPSPPVRSPWKNPWAVVILVIVALTAAGQVGCLIPQLLGTFFVIKLERQPPRHRRPPSPRFVRRRNNSANRELIRAHRMSEPPMQVPTITISPPPASAPVTPVCSRKGSISLEVPETPNFLNTRRAPHASVDSMELSSLCPSLNIEPLDTYSLQDESVQIESPRNGSVPQVCLQNGCTPTPKLTTPTATTPFLNNNFQDAFLQYNFIEKDTLRRELKRPRPRPASPNFLCPGTAAVMGRRYLKT